VTYAGAADPSLGVVGLPDYAIDLNRWISMSAFALALAQVPFI
jgi:hypothetical protein